MQIWLRCVRPPKGKSLEKVSEKKAIRKEVKLEGGKRKGE